MNKKVLFILLTLVMTLTLVPAFTRTAHAITVGAFDITGDAAGYSFASNTLTITANGTYTISMATPGTTTTDKIAVDSGLTAVNITLNGVNIDVSATNYAVAFNMNGATVSLTLQGTNTLKSGLYRAGIHVLAGAALTISGSGTVNATGGDGGAGIGGGGNTGSTGGAVTINSGTVNATGGILGAGIGGGGNGGSFGNGGAVTITGGTVNATGGNGGAGIGGSGDSGAGGAVTITGGTVNATGINAAGIGGGSLDAMAGSGGTLTITGGSVRRTGGAMSNEATATNGANGTGSNVYMTTLTVGSPAALNSAITAGSIGGVACSDTPDAASGVYGIKDVKTDNDGKLYFWLPASSAKSVVITTGGIAYVGSVTPSTAGTAAVTLFDITAPILTAGTVNRTSDTAAAIGFTTNEAGTAYYLVVASGATAPANTAVKAETSLGAVSIGAVSGKAVTLTAGAKDIDVVVQDAAGNISTPLKIEAAAYAPPPPTLDPQNNVTIGGDQINLADNASGSGWTWDATTKTLTLTGDLTDEIKIASETEEITIHITNNVNVPKITKTGNGALKITGEADNTLTVENTNGPAISSEGDIIIDSGTVKAIVTGTGDTEPTIKAGGDITITGTANVVASNSGTGDAINAGNGSGTISITGGRTEVTDQGNGTNPYPPTMSGANTVVIVNGRMIFGNSSSGGGCDAGAGVFALALLPLAYAGMKRKR
ncbi:hypothetical protein AGMMS49957_08480 [Synergistales bacterium]|nr:hypothetical protein AGMMS49957_08480 [Synergistales bacterium]